MPRGKQKEWVALFELLCAANDEELRELLEVIVYSTASSSFVDRLSQKLSAALGKK